MPNAATELPKCGSDVVLHWIVAKPCGGDRFNRNTRYTLRPERVTCPRCRWLCRRLLRRRTCLLELVGRVTRDALAGVCRPG
jgi:hypothetical protein